jgi:hypothetical protein
MLKAMVGEGNLSPSAASDLITPASQIAEEAMKKAAEKLEGQQDSLPDGTPPSTP